MKSDAYIKIFWVLMILGLNDFSKLKEQNIVQNYQRKNSEGHVNVLLGLSLTRKKPPGPKRRRLRVFDAEDSDVAASSFCHFLFVIFK